MYEIKIRMMNEDMAMKLLTPLGLGKPAAEETALHIYLKDEEVTRKIKDADGNLTYIVAKRHGPGFTYTAEPLDNDKRVELEAQYPPTVSLTIHRTTWDVEGASVELDRIEHEGVFLELHGNNFEQLKTIARRIGFSEHHYLTRTYDELA